MERLYSQQEINLYKEAASSSLAGETTSNEPDSLRQQISSLGYGQLAKAHIQMLPFPFHRSGEQGTHMVSSCAGLQQRQLYTAFQVPQASLDSEQGPRCAKRCLAAVVFVHINAQPGNVNHIPPSRYLRSKFIILPHGKLPVKFLFTQFSAALSSPQTTQLNSKTFPASMGILPQGCIPFGLLHTAQLQHSRKPTETNLLT